MAWHSIKVIFKNCTSKWAGWSKSQKVPDQSHLLAQTKQIVTPPGELHRHYYSLHYLPIFSPLLVALVFWVMQSCSPASVLILYANNYNKKNGPSFVFSFLPLNIQHKSNQNAYYYFLLLSLLYAYFVFSFRLTLILKIGAFFLNNHHCNNSVRLLISYSLCFEHRQVEII